MQINKSIYLFALIICLSVICILTPATSGEGDFFYYWYAGKLLIYGGNPYLDSAYTEMWQQLFGARRTLSKLYSFPHVITITSVLGTLNYYSAWYLWQFINVLFYLIFFLCFKNKIITKPLVVLFVATYPPLIANLILGQMTLMPLLGLTLLLSRAAPHSAIHGLALALLTLKPHIFLPVVLYFLLFLQKEFKKKIFLGFTLSFCTLLLLPELLQPGIYKAYFSAIDLTSAMWKNPTLGAVFQELFGMDNTWIRFVPSALFIIYILFRRIINSPLDMPCTVLPLALLCSPYLWIYDFIYLIPSILVFLSVSKNTKLPIFILYLLNILVCILGFGQVSVVIPIVIFILLLTHKQPLISTTLN